MPSVSSDNPLWGWMVGSEPGSVIRAPQLVKGMCFFVTTPLTLSQDEWLHTDHYNYLTVPGEMLFKLK